MNYEYYKEALDCSSILIEEIEKNNISVIPNMYINILLDYLISNYYEEPKKCKEIIENINIQCSQNTNLEREYEKEKWRIQWYLNSIKEVFG